MNKQLRIAIALELMEPYSQHQDVFLGIRRYARERPQWNCVVDECPGYSQSRRVELFQNYDGVIARASPTMQRRLGRLGVPLVNTWYQHSRKNLPGVYHDPGRIGKIAAEHLIARGFRRLSFLCSKGHRSGADAALAFRRYCEEAGFDCPLPHMVPTRFDTDRDWLETEKGLTAWLETLTPPVGICLQEAALSRLLINLCEARGWHVPQDIAIVSLNDNRMIAELSPQITCIDNNYELVGYEAAALLDRMINGESPPDEPIFIPPKGVVARQSTDYFAVEDEVVAAALRYISGRLQQKLTVEQVAQKVAVSPRTLQLRFSSALGRPISDEIRRQRLSAACRMLGDPAWQIAEIAQRSGFGGTIVMNQVFRRELGMPPSAYRKQVLGKREIKPDPSG